MITPAERKLPIASAQPAAMLMSDARERENIRMDPEPDADGDDQPQREVERFADGAREGHRVRCPAAGLRKKLPAS